MYSEVNMLKKNQKQETHIPLQRTSLVNPFHNSILYWWITPETANLNAAIARPPLIRIVEAGAIIYHLSV